MTAVQFRFALLAATLSTVVFGSRVSAQNTYSWSGATGGAWYTTSNWTGGPAGTYPGTSTAPGNGAATDIALFNNATATVGIDGGVGPALTLAGINFQSATSLSIGNGSTAQTAATLRLNGATINTVANTLVAIGNTGGDLTVTNVGPTGSNTSNTLGLVLGTTTGVFNLYGDATVVPFTSASAAGGALNVRTLTIAGSISEAAAGSGFTLQGGGVLNLTGANTFTGNIVINNGRLQVGNAAGSALGDTTGTTTVNSGGTLQFTVAQTNNENIFFGGTGVADVTAGTFGAIRVGNVAVTLGGTLTMNANARLYLDGSTTTIGNGIAETGGSRNLTTAGSGIVSVNGANTYTGTTTISQGTFDLTGANGALAAGAGAITVQDGGLLRLTNTLAANNTNRLPDAAAITLNNGRFTFNVSTTDAASFSETAGALNVTGGYLNTVTTNQAATGQSSALTFASLARATSGAVNFIGTGLGAVDNRNRVLFTTAPTVTNGMVGVYATYNVTQTTADFASYDATRGVIAMTNVNANLDGTGWGATQNLKFTIAATGGALTATGAQTVNSLTIIQNGATTAPNNVFDTNGVALTLGSGGLIYAGPPAGSGGGPMIINTSVFGGNLSTGANPLTVITPSGTSVDIRLPIVGTGGVVKLGDGLLILSGESPSLSGPVVISGSAGNGIRFDNTQVIGFSSFTLRAGTSSGGQGTALNLNAPESGPINIPLNMEAFLTGGVSNNFTTSDQGLNARSSLVTNSNNTWSGPITLTGNHFAQFYQTASGSTLTLSGTISAGAGGFTGMFLARGTSGGIVAITGTLNLPNATLAATDAETLLLPASAATALGLNPQSGNIQLGGNNLLPSAITVVLGQNGNGNQGQFWLNGFNQTISYFGIAGGSTATATGQIVQNGAAAGSNSVLTFTGGATPSTFAGVVRDNATAGNGTLGLTVTAGSLTLTGANTYTGVTTLNGGTLTAGTLANGGTASSIGGATNASANLAFGGGTLVYAGATASTDRGFTLNAAGGTVNVATAASSLTMSGVAAGTGSLTKPGAGTLILTGANTYAGSTFVTAGTLRVNNTTGNGTGGGPTVLANAGTTLMGTGKLGGGLTVAANTVLSPGNNAIGTLGNNAGTTAWNSNGIYTVEYDQSGSGSLAPGTTIDFYNSAGVLDMSGASSANPFVINLKYVGAAPLPPNTHQSVKIATFSALNGNVAANEFAITGDFLVGSTPTVSFTTTDVVINFTPVPEPVTILGVAAIGLAGAGWVRRRFAKPV
jgi:autotransporter-associated beta strand protein